MIRREVIPGVERPSMSPDLDLVLINREGELPSEPVLRGIDAQVGVRLWVHRVVGVRRDDDPNRWETIARARNDGRRLGSSPRLMFLDDDVILEPGTIARLVDGLGRRPGHAALACDYLDESYPTRHRGIGPGHVGMGATLFRRSAFSLFRFRWESGRCECQCCCDDLRRLGLRIEYLPGARASHLPSLTSGPHGGEDAPIPGRVLASFDRNHLARFRSRFLASLRAGGNTETVTAVTYGLRPSEARALDGPGVEVVALPEGPVVPAIRRLGDFQGVIRDWPALTPVAYWDAGDVRFQDRLGGLWDLVRANPERLLAVREPVGHPENKAVREWTTTIDDPASRSYAFDLLSTSPFLNSGFAAGTASTMLRYLEEAEHLRASSAIRGSLDWGDQTALNLYCHGDPARWHEVPEGWNYCLYQRSRREYRVRTDGRVESTAGVPIHVAHGNGSSFRPFELQYLS